MAEENKTTKVQQIVLASVLGVAVLAGVASFLTTEPDSSRSGASQQQTTSPF